MSVKERKEAFGRNVKAMNEAYTCYTQGMERGKRALQ